MATELDLESLARLQAQLRRPFTAREDVLRAAGVDEPMLAAAQAHWSEQLTAADGGPLRDRYVAAFAGLEAPAADPPPAAVEEPTAGVDAQPDEPEPRAAAPFLQPASRQPVPSYMIGSAPLRAQPPMHPVPPMLVPAAPTPPASVPVPAAAPPKIDIDATRPPLRRRLGSTLPFARGQDVPDAVRAAWADAKAEAQAKARVVGMGGAKTMAIDETALIPPSKPGGSSTPFEKKASDAPPGPRIPLEEYAAFLVELAQDPSREGRLRAKYGIEGDQAQRALGAAFAAIFQREPSERARFDVLIATVGLELRSRGLGEPHRRQHGREVLRRRGPQRGREPRELLQAHGGHAVRQPGRRRRVPRALPASSCRVPSRARASSSSTPASAPRTTSSSPATSPRREPQPPARRSLWSARGRPSRTSGATSRPGTRGTRIRCRARSAGASTRTIS